MRESEDRAKGKSPNPVYIVCSAIVSVLGQDTEMGQAAWESNCLLGTECKRRNRNYISTGAIIQGADQITSQGYGLVPPVGWGGDPAFIVERTCVQKVGNSFEPPWKSVLKLDQ